MKLKCPKCGEVSGYSGYPPNPQASTVVCLTCGWAGMGAAFKRVFEKGDKVKVRFGGSVPPMYKHGTFDHYSENGKYGFFIWQKPMRHIRYRIIPPTIKILKRRSEAFLMEE